MPNKPLTVLGINPGSRYIGFAVVQWASLTDWGTKLVAGGGSREKLAKATEVVEDLVERNKPTVIALKRLHSSRTSPQLDQLVDEIKKLARQKRLRVCQYSIGELEAFFCYELKVNRAKLAEAVASQHPVLLRELAREQANKNPYHLRMFEAVALATASFYRIDNQ